MLRVRHSIGALPAAILSAIMFASPASAVSLVVDGVDGTYTQLESRSPGVYGVELRGGRAGAADWEIGVGNQTSNVGTFNQGEFDWSSARAHEFSLSWTATGLSITVGGVTVNDTGTGKGAPLVGNTLKIDLKGLSSLTLASLDGVALNRTFDQPGSNLFFSSDSWGGNGFTATGVLAIENGGGSRHGINFKLGNFTPNPAIPEPASWAMMIAGFGLVGAAMRRRRTAATA